MYFAFQLEGTPQEQGAFLQRLDLPGRVGGWRPYGRICRVPRQHAKDPCESGDLVRERGQREEKSKEIPNWDLDGLGERHGRRNGMKAGHIEVSGGNANSRRVFYSALYHALLHPSIFSDENGEYIGFDKRFIALAGSSTIRELLGMDIYRCQVQLIAMLFPKQASDIAQSLVNDAEQGGGLPIWPVANDKGQVVMVGDPLSDLASIYAFGARDFDAKKALKLMVRGADDPEAHVRLYPERPHLKELLARGDIAESEDSQGSASVASKMRRLIFQSRKWQRPWETRPRRIACCDARPTGASYSIRILDTG